MDRVSLGGFPIEIEKNKNTMRLKFYPKNPDAKHPNHPVLILELDESEKKKLLDIIGQ